MTEKELLFSGEVKEEGEEDEYVRLPLVSSFQPGKYAFIEAEVEGAMADDVYLCNVLIKGASQFLVQFVGSAVPPGPFDPKFPLSWIGPTCFAPRFVFPKIESESDVRVLVKNLSGEKARVRFRLLTKPRFAREMIPGETPMKLSLIERVLAVKPEKRFTFMWCSAVIVGSVICALIRLFGSRP